MQIGARPSESPVDPARTSNPGLIFAECNDYPLSVPGTLYDTDRLTVFWSWFARRPAQVQDFIDNANFVVTVAGQTLPVVVRSDIQRREDGNYWVFYTADLDDSWTPGDYDVQYRITWDNPIFDGISNYGPDTENPQFSSSCNFTVQRNPFGVNVSYKYPFAGPLQQHLTKNDARQ